MSRLSIKFSSKFKKDYKLASKQHQNIDELFDVIDKLADRVILDPKYNDHSLSGKYENCRECHVSPDFLLIYRVYEDELVLLLLRAGSHSNLFK